MSFYTTMMFLIITKVILMSVLVGGFFYNIFTSKKKRWNLIFLFLFLFLLVDIYEGEVLEDQMFDQAYNDIYESEFTQTSSVNSKEYCSYNKYDCTDFETQSETQVLFEACGGVNNDVHHFDKDKDGIACEWLS